MISVIYRKGLKNSCLFLELLVTPNSILLLNNPCYKEKRTKMQQKTSTVGVLDYTYRTFIFARSQKAPSVSLLMLFLWSLSTSRLDKPWKVRPSI